MTTICGRVMLIGGFVGVSLAAGAAPRIESSMALNALQVQQLVARAEPADHARLEVHFSTLADRYDAESRRHERMALMFRSTPSRSVTAGAGSHFTRLAALNAQSATTLRRLAAHHGALAGGRSSLVPRGGARFEGGAGTSVPTRQDFRDVAAAASTPAEHHAVEEYFRTLARRYAADAQEHAGMARAYRGTRIAQTAAHWERMAGLSHDAAQEANAVASLHKQLADITR